MNVEIGAEAALFLEKEYIKGIFVAVRWGRHYLLLELDKRHLLLKLDKQHIPALER
jgi:hypothetical protein